MADFNARPIKVVYTKESGRPPLYTTEANKNNIERFFGTIIKDIYLVDGKGNIIEKQPVKKSEPVIILPPRTQTNPFMDPHSSFDPFNDMKKSELAPVPLAISAEDAAYDFFVAKTGKSREEIDSLLSPEPKKVARKAIKKDKTEKV